MLLDFFVPPAKIDCVDKLVAILFHTDAAVRSLFRATGFVALISILCRWAWPQSGWILFVEGGAVMLLYWTINVSLWPASPCGLTQRLAGVSRRADGLLDHTHKHPVGMLDPLLFRGHQAHFLFGSIHVTPRSVAELDEDTLCWMVLRAHLKSKMSGVFAKNLALAILAWALLSATFVPALGVEVSFLIGLAGLLLAPVLMWSGAKRRNKIAHEMADELMGQSDLRRLTASPSGRWTYASAFDERGALSVLDEAGQI